MFKSDNSFNVLIGKSISRTASVQVLDTTASSTYIANGEVLVLDENDAPLTAGATFSDTKKIRIVQGQTATTPLVRSMVIDGSNVTGFKGLSYAAPQEQIDYIGYNTSSGSIDAISINEYTLRTTFTFDKANWSEQANTRFYQYVSDSSATQLEIANAFVGKVIADTFTDIKAEVVSDGTASAIGGGTTLTVTNGSTLAVASGAGHNLIAGDSVRIGGAGASFGIYTVSSVSGVNITLNLAYQGASGAGVAGFEMSAQTAWGIKLTGKAQTNFSVGLFPYYKVSFNTSLSGWGTTAVTNAQTVKRGSGTYEEVAELEWFSLGFDGIRNRSHHPIPTGRANAVSGATYDAITIDHFDSSDYGPVAGVKPAKSQVFIFMVDGAAQTTNLLAQLNPWMASLPRAFAAVIV